MIATAFLIAALVLFIIDSINSRSLVSAGLACATAAFLAGKVAGL